MCPHKQLSAVCTYTVSDLPVERSQTVGCPCACWGLSCHSVPQRQATEKDPVGTNIA